MPIPTVTSSAPAKAHDTSPQRAPQGATAESFRGRVSPERAREARRERPPQCPRGALVPAPDGSFVVVPSFAQYYPKNAAPAAPRSAGITGIYAQIDQVRVGVSRHDTHLHVRLADGPFAGVELRGVQHGARVAVEVLQDPTRPPVDLDELRRALAARGIHSVDLSFADAHDAPRRPPPEAQLEALEDGAHEAPRARKPVVRDDEL